jgi:hypothetical protein
MTQGFREMIRSKKSAQKAHARRERRRATRQKEVGNQPQPPADNPQKKPDVEGNGSISAEAGTEPPTEDWAPPTELSQGSGWECYDPIGPIAGNRETGGPIEAGDTERPRRIEYSHKETQVDETQKEEQRDFRGEVYDSATLISEKDTKHREAMRLYRKARKLAYELREPRKREKPVKEAKRVYRAYITLEDQVGVHHLKHRVGRREEFQTNLTHPHQFRKALIRVFHLKNLRWSLFHVDREGNRARMPQLMQIIEDDTEYVLVIEEQRRKRPNAPGTSKRRHFERANQKRGRGDFEWHPPQPCREAPGGWTSRR